MRHTGKIAVGLGSLFLIGWQQSVGYAQLDEWHVTSGAVSGYVPDEACASCHEGLWDSYQEVGMARAFSRVRVEDAIEDFDHAHFFHELSGNHYEMVVRDEEIFQRRYRTDSEGLEYAVLERKIDWIVGSGNHGRGYFYRTDMGEMYLLPLMWYAQDQSWGMAPGYDNPQHSDFSRQIGRRCMSCHNAYPEVKAGSDFAGQPFLFPQQLPEGIGCQRCHGPGAEHVRLAEREEATDEELRAAIVNPMDLEPAARDDVCNQCHLQATSAFDDIVQRFGKGSYSFQPGMVLEDSHFPVNVDSKTDSPDRFEVNHASFRLKQSLCYQESDGQISCLTCHDPHRKIPALERAAHFRAKCMGCHEPDVCSKSSKHTSRADVDADDCVGCHMPKRRTRDVVNVMMTDHLIRRRLAPESWIAPRREEAPTYRGSEILRVEALKNEPHAVLYGAMAGTNSGSDQAVLKLQTVLDGAQGGTFEAWLRLGEQLFLLERVEEAAEAFRRCIELAPNLATAHHKLGSTLVLMGKPDAALKSLTRSLELAPNQPETHLIAALLLANLNRLDEAISHLLRATELRPHQFQSHLTLANLYVRTGDLVRATKSYRAARRADPRDAVAHDNLGLVYRLRGNWKRALHTWKLGLECAPEDLSLNRHLGELLLTTPKDNLRDPEQALPFARRAVELGPDDPACALLLALAFLETGNFEGARDEAKRAGSIDSGNYGWRLVYAQAVNLTGKQLAARTVQAIAKASTRPKPSDLLHVYIQKNYGNPSEASLRNGDE